MVRGDGLIYSRLAEDSTQFGIRMSHREWRMEGQQPDLVLLGLSLISLHFLCDILRRLNWILFP